MFNSSEGHLFKVLAEMSNKDDASNLSKQWCEFTNVCGPTYARLEVGMYRGTLTQNDPIGWWTLHGKGALDLRILVCFLSQVVSSSSAKRNRCTYSSSNKSKGTILPLDDQRS